MEDNKQILKVRTKDKLGEEIINNFLDYNGMLINKNNLEENTDLINRYKLRESPSIPLESVEHLESFYLLIMNNFDETEVLTNFTKIFNLYSQNKDVLFLAFWFPYIKSKEGIVIEILNKTKIFCCTSEIQDVYSNSYSASLLNTYAFQLAITNNFNENFIDLILDQGKIKIPIEWILEKIILKRLDPVERALNGGNDCTISNKVLIDIVSERLESNEFFKGIIQNKVRKSFSKFSSKKNFYNNKSSVNLESNTESVSKGKEITFFLMKRTGKLTLTKILIFASLINYYYKEMFETSKNQNIEEFNIENLIKTICLFDRKEKQFSVQILQGLYLIKQKKIARELLEARLLSKDIGVFKTSLEYKDLKFSLEFYQLNKNLNLYDNENLHFCIIEHIYEDVDNIEIYLYLMKNFINSNFVKTNAIKLLLKIIEDLLQANSEIISDFYNPVKIFILFSEILTIIKTKFPFISNNISRLILKCLEYSENLLNLIEEDQVFREIILEKDLSNRSLLDIISDNNLLVLLKIKFVENIVDDLWNGPYSTEGSFLETSYNYKALKTSFNSRDYDIYTKMRKGLTDYNEEEYETNFTHFKVWKKNVYIKYYSEIFITLLLLVFFQTTNLIIISKYQSVLGRDLEKINYFGNEINIFLYGNGYGDKYRNNFNFTNFPSPVLDPVIMTYIFNSSLIINQDYFELTKFCNSSILKNETIAKIINEARDIYLDIFNDKVYKTDYCVFFLISATRLFYLLPISYVLRFIFQFKFNKSEYGLTIWSDIILFSADLMVRVLWDIKPLLIIKNMVESLNNEKVNCFNFLPFFNNNFNLILGDPQWKDLLLISIVCLCLWLRFILLIRGTKILGPIIEIFFLAVNGIKYYLFIFFSIIFAYTSFALSNFYNVDGLYFKNILLCFYYYTVVSLGGDPSYDSFYKQSTDGANKLQNYVPWLGAICIFIVLIFNTVTMLNIIIAHLTNIYEKYSNYSQQLFIQKKIEIRRKFCSEDPKFDSLLVSIYPFDVISLIPAVFLFFSKNENMTNKINKIILWLNFCLFAICYSIVYLISTAVLIPFSFFKIVISKFIQIFIDDFQNYRVIYKIFSFLTYSAFGLFFHLYQLFIDFIIFIKELNKEKISLLSYNENFGKLKIRLSLLKLIISITLNINDDNVYKIHVEKFMEIFLTVLEKNDLIRQVEIIEFFDKFNQARINPYKINEEFNIYYNKFQKRMFLKNIDYQGLCEFLSNFWNDENVIDLNKMKTILNIYWRGFKTKRFLIKISEKNYKFARIANKNLLSVCGSITLNKYQTVENITQNHLNSHAQLNTNKAYSPVNKSSQNDLTPTVDLTRLRRFSDYFRDYEASFGIKNYDENILTKSLFANGRTQNPFTEMMINNLKTGMILKTFVKKKLSNLKLQKDSKEFCIIPIIPRLIIYTFLSSMKDYKSDANKMFNSNNDSNFKNFPQNTKLNSELFYKENFNKELINKDNLNKDEFIKNNVIEEINTIEENEEFPEMDIKQKTKVFLNTTKKEFFTKSMKIKFNNEEMVNKFNCINNYNSKNNYNSNSNRSHKDLYTNDIAFESPPSSTKTLNTDIIEFGEPKIILNDKVLFSEEIFRMEEKFEEVDKKITKLEKTVQDILLCTILMNDKLDKILGNR